MSRSSVMTRPVKPNLPAQQIRDDAAGKRRWQCLRLRARDKSRGRSSCYRPDRLPAKMAEHRQFLRFEFRAGERRFPAVRGAHRARRGNSRENACRNSGCPSPRSPSLNAPALRIDLRDVVPVAAPAQRIVRLIIERNIEHRAEIEIEAENAQQPAGDRAVAPDQLEIVLVAELLRVRRLVADQLQPRNAPAFLVDGDDRLDLAQIAQIIDQLPKLRGRPDIAAEEMKPPGWISRKMAAVAASSSGPGTPVRSN